VPRNGTAARTAASTTHTQTDTHTVSAEICELDSRWQLNTCLNWFSRSSYRRLCLQVTAADPVFLRRYTSLPLQLLLVRLLLLPRDRHTETQTDIHRDTQQRHTSTAWQLGLLPILHTHRHTRTDIHTDRQTDRHRDIHTDTQAEIHSKVGA